MPYFQWFPSLYQTHARGNQKLDKRTYLFRGLETKDADYLWTTNWIGILHNQEFLLLGGSRQK